MNQKEVKGTAFPLCHEDPLSWDDSFAIALELKQRYPNVSLEELSLNTIYHLTITLPNFFDDKELANETILQAILNEWLEDSE